MATEYFLTKTRDGQGPRRISIACDSKEEAIRELHDGWRSFVNEKMFYNVEGELVDSDHEDGPIHFDGETGWYNCNGDLEYRTANFPETAEEWIAKDVDRYRHDVYVYGIEEAEESSEEE